MSTHVAITVLAEPAELEQRWTAHAQRADDFPGDATVRFQRAPGDRGTEIHVELPDLNPIASAAKKVTGSDPRANALDELRRFKQLVETGVIAQSDGTPVGESHAAQPKQRPAQPVEEVVS